MTLVVTYKDCNSVLECGYSEDLYICYMVLRTNCCCCIMYLDDIFMPGLCGCGSRIINASGLERPFNPLETIVTFFLIVFSFLLSRSISHIGRFV